MTTATVKQRRPWLAGLLNLLVGYVYVGRFQYGVILLLSLLLSYGVLAWSSALSYFTGFLILCLLLIGFYVGIVVDGIRIARKQTDYQMKPYNRCYVYVSVYLLFNVGLGLLSPYRGRIYGYEPYRFPSGSMMPAMLQGDYLVTDTNYYESNPVQRGDIIIFRYPKDPSIDYAKRVIGLPGDRFRYNYKQIFINGKPISQQSTEQIAPEVLSHGFYQAFTETLDGKNYTIIIDGQRPTLNSESIVPEGQYYVMGDNRDNSNDSRYWGFVAHENLIGKSLYVWLSYSSLLNKIRTERFGWRLDE